MCPWLVRVERGGVWVTVARCVSSDLAHAVVRFLFEADGVVAEVYSSEGPRFR